jgi:hypothetical protein
LAQLLQRHAIAERQLLRLGGRSPPAIDRVRISGRLGHARPTVTLRIYADLLDRACEATAVAIDAVMR